MLPVPHSDHQKHPRITRLRERLHGTWGTVLAAIMLLVSPGHSHALDTHTRFRDYTLENWSTAQGLPQISVESISQDRDGFLWIGTQDGIARFDGVKFRVYDRGNTGIDASLVVSSWADAKGAVWFGTSAGLLREEGGRFQQWRIGRVNAIVGNLQDEPVLATASGIGLWHRGKLQLFPGLEGPFFALLRTGETLWAGGLDQLCRHGSNGATQCYRLPAGSERRVTALAWTDNAVWVGTTAGLLRFDGTHFDPVPPFAPLATSDIRSMLRDRSGNLWIGTINALYRRYPEGRLESVSAKELPPNPWIDSMYMDRDGNLWLGSRTQSLYRVSNSWTTRYGAASGFDDPFIWSIAANPDGGLDIGTNSGLSLLRDGHATTLVAGADLPNPAVYDLYRDSAGRLWIGTRGGVAVLNHGALEEPAVLAPLRPWQVSDIIEYPTGTVWLGTHGGLFRFQDGKLDRYGAPAGSAASRIRAILPIAGSALLIGTEDGVREWRSGKLEIPAWSKPLRGHFVTSLGWLDRHTLLLTTLDAGLALLHDGHLVRLTKANGLPTDNAWAFVLHRDAVYFSSIDGVWRIPRSQLMSPFSANGKVNAQAILGGNDIVGQEERTRCCNGGGGGRMLRVGDSLWLPSINGALALDLASVHADPSPGRPRIERLRHRQQWYPLDARTTLALGERSIDIAYTAPYLRHAARLEFRYRLLNYDPAWVLAGHRRTAYYTQLPPGHYHFEVQVSNGQHRWSESTILKINVPPYWYELRWLQFIAGLALVVAVAAAVRWRGHRLRSQQQRLEALVSLRTEELRRANDRLRQANDALTAESLSDPLTGLGNRRLLAQSWPEIRRQKALAVVLIDLDHFKRINDRYGHGVGDVVLRDVAQLILRLKEPQDIALRWGGEEFLLLLPGVDGMGALALGERIRLAVRAHDFNDPSLSGTRVTCSIGISHWPLLPALRDRDLGGTIELADFAMYRVKSQGRDATLALLPGPKAAPSLLTAPAVDIEQLVATGVLRWQALD